MTDTAALSPEDEVIVALTDVLLPRLEHYVGIDARHGSTSGIMALLSAVRAAARDGLLLGVGEWDALRAFLIDHDSRTRGDGQPGDGLTGLPPALIARILGHPAQQPNRTSGENTMPGSATNTSTTPTTDDGPTEHDGMSGLIRAINDVVSAHVLQAATSASDREAITNEIAALIHDDLTILASGWIDPPTA